MITHGQASSDEEALLHQLGVAHGVLSVFAGALFGSLIGSGGLQGTLAQEWLRFCNRSKAASWKPRQGNFGDRCYPRASEVSIVSACLFHRNVRDFRPSQALMPLLRRFSLCLLLAGAVSSWPTASVQAHPDHPSGSPSSTSASHDHNHSQHSRH